MSEENHGISQVEIGWFSKEKCQIVANIILCRNIY